MENFCVRNPFVIYTTTLPLASSTASVLIRWKRAAIDGLMSLTLALLIALLNLVHLTNARWFRPLLVVRSGCSGGGDGKIDGISLFYLEISQKLCSFPVDCLEIC